MGVVGRQEDGTGHRALGEQLADLRGGGIVHHRRTGPLEQDLAHRVAGDPHGEPPHEPEVLVGRDFEPEGVDVEVEGFVLVEDEQL